MRLRHFWIDGRDFSLLAIARPMEKTWQKNSGSQIVLDSIFAALAALWLTIVISDQIGATRKLVEVRKLLEVIFSLFSFLFFAVSAEGTATAYEENDVKKFVYYLVWYNFGVILIGCAVVLFIFAQFELDFWKFATAYLNCLSNALAECLLDLVAYGGLVFGLFWTWIRDVSWLLWRADENEFNDYLRELCDEQAPKREHRCLMRLVFKKRL
jgi:hypothetical protein